MRDGHQAIGGDGCGPAGPRGSTCGFVRACAAATLLLAFAMSLTACQPEGTTDHWLSDVTRPMAGDPDDREAARMAFDPYDANERRQGVLLLAAGEDGGEPVRVRMYRLLLDDGDAAVRAAAVRALAVHGGAEDVERIAELLENDPADFVRWEAAKALQRLHDPAASGPLRRAVRDDTDSDVRAAAADALGQYAESAVFHTLVGALHDTSFTVVEASVRSLETLTGAQLGADSRAWLSWSEANRGNLFENRQTYTYRPYPEVPGMLRRLQFWRDEE